MEPHDLKPTPPDDAQFEAWLRANATLPPLPDDGFSQAVLTALPAPARPRRSRRLLAMLAGAVAGLGVAAWPVFSGGSTGDLLPALDDALLAASHQLTNPALGLALAATFASLFFVFWRDLRRLVPW